MALSIVVFSLTRFARDGDPMTTDETPNETPSIGNEQFESPQTLVQLASVLDPPIYQEAVTAWAACWNRMGDGPGG